MLKNSLDKPRTVAIIRPDSVKSGHFCCAQFHHASRGRTASVDLSAEVVRPFCVRRMCRREVRPHA